MITLTTPIAVKSQIGGSATVNYDKLFFSRIEYNPETLHINATFKVVSTATPEMNPITGTLDIDVATGKFSCESSQLDFYRRINLSAGQKTQVTTVIRDAQNVLEASLITLGVAAGNQSAGV